MQASGLFELACNGTSRRDNLLPLRSKTDDYAWPASSSFNPNKHSVALLHSPWLLPTACTDSLPQTPIIAGLPKDKLPNDRLPGINNMLTVTDAPIFSCSDATVPPPVTTHSPPTLMRLGSWADKATEEGQFLGPRPQWVQDEVKSTFVGVRAPTLRLERHFFAPSSHFSSKLSPPKLTNAMYIEGDSDGATGLGISAAAAADDATPRLGDCGTFSPNVLGLSTPRQSNYASSSRHVYTSTPRAPSLAQEGFFTSTIPTSPIQPPLKGLNIDLRFGNSPFVAPSGPSARSAPPTPRSAAMEREQIVQLQSGMPHQLGIHGLGISLDSTSPSPEASFSRIQLIVSPSAGEAILSSPSSSVMSATASTGLTPSLQLASLSVQDNIEAASPTSPASPSFRAQRRKRSDLVRRQAAAAAQNGLEKGLQSPSRSAALSQPACPLDRGNTPAIQSTVPQISPRKRPLGERDVNLSVTASTRGKGRGRGRGKDKPGSEGKVTPSDSGNGAVDDSASPWGVFRLKSQCAWKPSGPPGCSKGVGFQAVKSSASSQSLPGGFGSTQSSPKKQKRQPLAAAVDDLGDLGKKVASRLENVGYTATHTQHDGRNSSNKENMPLSRPATAGARLGVISGSIAGPHRLAARPAAGSRPGSAHGQGQSHQRRSPLMSLR